MTKSSSDGRSREKPSRAIPHDKNSFARGPKHAGEYLKPASPPKTNPWTTRRPTTTVSPDWPSITPDFARSHSQGNEKGATTLKDEAEIEQNKDSSRPGAPSGSDTSSPSEKAMQVAAPRASQSLWLRPFGADIFVQVGPVVYLVHRSIVEPQSTFFQHHLPPRRDLASCQHEPIDIHLDLDPSPAGHTLRFMYTQSWYWHTHLTYLEAKKKLKIALEYCEYDRESPRDLIHIPRIVLLYLGAVHLGVEAMKSMILQTLEQTAGDVAMYLQAGTFAQAMNTQEAEDAVFHLLNALEVAYSSSHLTDMLPLRLALCKALDALLPYLIQYPVLIHLLSSSVWKKYAAAVSADLLAARNTDNASSSGTMH